MHGFFHAPGRDVVFDVERLLFFTAAVGFFNRAAHGIGDLIRIHNNPSVYIARSTAYGLDERSRGTQKAFLIRVQNRHEADLRQVKPFAQQVDAHKHIKLAQTKIPDDLHTFDCFNVGMHIAHAHAHGVQIFRKRFRHALCKRGGKRAISARRHLLYLAQKIVNLAFYGAHADLRVNQTCWADDLLHRLAGKPQFILPGRGRNADQLVDALAELFKTQRSVIERRRQAKAVFHQVFLTGTIPAVHSAHLRQRHVGFIHNHEEILGEIIKQRKRRLPGFASVKIAGIVLNALAIADFAHHFDVVQRSLFNALCLKKLVRSLKLVYALPQVVFNLPDCRLQLFLAGCIM